MKKYSYKERLDHELKRRITKESQKEFFKGAVTRMNYDDRLWKLYKDKEFACDVLCHTGFCLNVDCEHCLLEGKFRDALKDFEMGVR